MRARKSCVPPAKKRKEMSSASSSSASAPVVLMHDDAMDGGGGGGDGGGLRPGDARKGCAPGDTDERRWARRLAAPKKIVIHPFKVQPTLPPDFVQTSTERLARVVGAIHANQPLPESPELVYRAVQALCLHSKAQNLYQCLAAQCESHIGSSIARVPVAQADPVKFLSSIRSLWDDHCRQMRMIQAIFLYLDRTFVIQNPQIRSLWHMGLQLFRENFLSQSGVKTESLQSLLSLIERQRRGELVDIDLLKAVLEMYSALTIYKTEFEASFLQATSAFYREEGSRLTSELDVPAYLEHVSRRLSEEKQRAHTYIDESSLKQLIVVTESHLLKAHTDVLQKKGFDALIQSGDRKSLSLMYQLFGRVGAWDVLRLAFTSYIMRIGRQIVSDESKDAEMIEKILALKVDMDLVLQEAFGNNSSFLHSLKDAFEKFINSRQNRPAELLAKFVDHLLRHGARENTQQALEKIIDDCIVIFRYMHGKDVFEAFYKKDLSKRLLLNTSCSDEAERHIISKLKLECGCRFTSNIECMFKDIKLSKEMMEQYRQHVQNSQSPLSYLEFEVFVLTTSSWPVVSGSEVALPEPVVQHQSQFEKFYVSKHSGRKLTWQQQHAQCVLRASFQQGRKELAVSAFQAVVLLAFNDCKIIKFADLLSRTRMDSAQLKATLASLTRQKLRLLKKRPAGPLSEKDEFTVNADFQHKLFRVRVTQQSKETADERSSTSSRVFADRQYQIDAAIVRIMKSRKTLSHTLLISECLSSLKFPVEMPDLKKRIESLIERDYIERAHDDASTYRYCA